MRIHASLGRFRHKVILAATARGLERFENLDEMPPGMRTRCLKALESRDSGTVLISGQAAAEPGPAAAAVRPAEANPAPGSEAGRRGESWIALWLRVAVAAAAAAALWISRQN